MSSARDIALVARFEVLRAIRTWRALALVVLYAVASCGAAYIFVQVVGVLENELARTLGVAETKVPGTMVQELVKSDGFRSLLAAMVGSDELVDRLLGVPVLAIFHLWFGFLLVPFFAAATSAESIAIDAGSRALRFEVLRTGRLELVAGRFVGQLGLTAAATAASALGVWAIGLWAMRGNSPVELAWWLGWLSVRAWFFSVPFAGVGLACSQLTNSPAWARVLAVGLTAGSWVAYGLARAGEETRWAPVSDVALQVLPQGWIGQMWQPTGWALSAAVCTALGFVATLVGYARFARRDL